VGPDRTGHHVLRRTTKAGAVSDRRICDVYGILPGRVLTTPRTATIFMTNRSQAVPKEYHFSTNEVFIRKEGQDVILSPRTRAASA